MAEGGDVKGIKKEPSSPEGSYLFLLPHVTMQVDKTFLMAVITENV